MKNKYRLSSSAFEREDEQDKIEPQKIYFLSVEGNDTEKEYFEGVSRYRNKLEINVRVDVEVLKRRKKDTNSAPQQVLELLEEYLRLREIGKENLLDDLPKEFVERFGIDFIEKYLSQSQELSRRERNSFETELMKIGYDISYRRYLQRYDSEYDEFAVLIDRDMRNHSQKNMKDCIAHCKLKNYTCYISNPCFEFWLLLHVADVGKEYKDKLNLIKENKKISNNHTFVSKELSDKVHHGKSGINF